MDSIHKRPTGQSGTLTFDSRLTLHRAILINKHRLGLTLTTRDRLGVLFLALADGWKGAR